VSVYHQHDLDLCPRQVWHSLNELVRELREHGESYVMQ
jgi:hypothetical protein